MNERLTRHYLSAPLRDNRSWRAGRSARDRGRSFQPRCNSTYSTERLCKVGVKVVYVFDAGREAKKIAGTG